MGAGLSRLVCRVAQKVTRHGSRLKLAGVPAGSGREPAWEPVYAGLDAGWRGRRPGMVASPCRLGCRLARGPTRHGSRPEPAAMPAVFFFQLPFVLLPAPFCFLTILLGFVPEYAQDICVK